jgi:hypothetical protein
MRTAPRCPTARLTPPDSSNALQLRFAVVADVARTVDVDLEALAVISRRLELRRLLCPTQVGA